MKILSTNSTIGVIAPGFQPDQTKLGNGIRYLKNKGFRIKHGKSLTAKHGYFAGSDDLRIEDIHTMFEDDEVDAIICARGGWGCLRLLDKIDYDLIKKNKKILIGYSDITSLQLALLKKITLPSLSGPMVAIEMAKKMDSFTEKYFWNQLLSENETLLLSLSENRIDTLIAGKAKGTLIGGCLSMISAQLATPYSPNYDGAILFLEDINEPLYKIDRYLSQLRLSGIFKAINGLIIGNFINCGDNQKNLNELFFEYLSGMDIPVIINFPYGHSVKKISLPIGTECTINTKNSIIQINSCYSKQGVS